MKESKHKMKLYHGTNYSSAINIVNHGIDLKYSKPYLDFGAELESELPVCKFKF